MKIIELTYYDGKKIYINTGAILYFMYGNDPDADKTFIDLSNERRIWVKETPDQVLKKIKEATK